MDHKPLVNIVSMMAIPDAAKNYILNRDEKKQARYEEFVTHIMIDEDEDLQHLVEEGPHCCWRQSSVRIDNYLLGSWSSSSRAHN